MHDARLLHVQIMMGAGNADGSGEGASPQQIIHFGRGKEARLSQDEESGTADAVPLLRKGTLSIVHQTTDHHVSVEARPPSATAFLQPVCPGHADCPAAEELDSSIT